MNPDTLHSLVDGLIARDREYRPLELLVAARRLERADLDRFEQGRLRQLEDLLYGDPTRSIELLDHAARWARELGLEPQIRDRESGQGACFRDARADRQARTSWRRREGESQGDLFMDNRLSVARAQLVRQLEAGDRAGAEAALADLSRADPASELQVDGEHLVGAMAWLDELPEDHAALLTAIDEDLGVRARRVLGPGQARRFLARFWRALAETRRGLDFDPAQPALSPALLLIRCEDWAGALAALDQEPTRVEHPPLLVAELRAALQTGERERGLTALCQLCWRHGQAAEAWLDVCDDDELARRVEQFWDLEPALDIELFPAWLLTRGYPMPVVQNPPEIGAAEAMDFVRALRRKPDDLAAREWLQAQQPELLELWIGMS